ncbi:MAG: hypothetical protein ABIB97_03595 [Patescibacteria group bacterium]
MGEPGRSPAYLLREAAFARDQEERRQQQARDSIWDQRVRLLRDRRPPQLRSTLTGRNDG